jgi:hypothetical protein
MNWKRFARTAGICLTILAAAFLAHRIVALELWRQDLDFRRLAPVFALTVPVYAAAVGLLAIAWIVLLGRVAPPAQSGIAWYLISQFGKYLPGNVAHLAGRHLLFASARVPTQALLGATATEAGLFVCSGVAVIAALAPLSITPTLGDLLSPGSVRWLPLLPAAAVAVILVWLMRGSADRREKLAAMGIASLLYLAFYAVAGGILVALIQFISPGHGAANEWPFIVAAWSAAWLCGFAVPGAPGGLGVRESVLVLLLSPVAGSETALLGALAHRGVSLSGDGLAALLGIAMTKWPVTRHLVE